MILFLIVLTSTSGNAVRIFNSNIFVYSYNVFFLFFFFNFNYFRSISIVSNLEARCVAKKNKYACKSILMGPVSVCGGYVRSCVRVCVCVC